MTKKAGLNPGQVVVECSDSAITGRISGELPEVFKSALACLGGGRKRSRVVILKDPTNRQAYALVPLLDVNRELKRQNISFEQALVYMADRKPLGR